MTRRINQKFLDIYLLLDSTVCDKFCIEYGGVTEYINRLNDARYAVCREAVLSALVRYRSIRNMLAHEPGAMRASLGITRADLSWIKRFIRDIRRSKDPVSRYIRKAERALAVKKMKI